MIRIATRMIPAVLFGLGCAISPVAAQTEQERLETFLLDVYRTMDDNYYMPVSIKIYGKFTEVFTAERLMQLNEINKKADDYVHLGAGLLVDKLKREDDRFTNFIPPKKTEEFKQKAYAVTYDLGLEGELTDKGYELRHVERHSDAFLEGIRPGDILTKIDARSVFEIPAEELPALLKPEEGAEVSLEILFSATGEFRVIVLESKSYFKETVFHVATDIPGVFIARIQHFNQKTSHDLAADIAAFGAEELRHLVLDLRNNEGGPPLAAREVLGFFTPTNDPLFAIARRKRKPVLLTSPTQEIRYEGPTTVLVNARTGSAAETLSGILQAKGIARLVGVQTAGATYLKSIYDFDDGSALFMITSQTYYFDRRVFPKDGLTPDVLVSEGEDALELVLQEIRREPLPSR